MGNQCISCLYACNPYVEWIEKQKEQFDKQVKKYKTEITRGGASGSGSRKKRAASTKVYDGYESKFYKELQSNGYRTVDAFLGLLNNEKACQDIKDDKEGGTIHFEKVNTGGTAGTSGGTAASGGTSGTNVESQGTFYRSDYCQPCPYCGVQREGKGWEKKSVDENCTRGKRYKPKGSEVGTTINFLYSGEGEKDIETKLEAFCAEKNGDTTNSGGGSGGSGSKSGSQKLYQNWQCYQFKQLDKVGQDDDEDDVNGSGGICILETTNHEGVQKQKTYNDFFYYWVAHMLKDSIHWRTKRLKSCINNGKKECIKKCNGKCDCFLKWVQHKHQEWGKIIEHFYKQDDFKDWKHNDVLEGVLEKGVLLTSLREGYGNTDDIKRIEA
ncbi:hypothetical protein PFTANZ_06383, partial [Plasmodium falciparum Tanzania (2000708)]